MSVGWKQEFTKVAHSNPWFQVREDDVIRPDGSKGKYFVVDVVGSVIVVAWEQGEFYLVQQSRYSIGNKKSLEFVAGGMKEGKEPLAMAKEELAEEIGATAKEWIDLGYFYPLNGYCSEKCYVFLAKGLIVGKNHPEPTEDIVIKKLKEEELVDLIKKNIISDGMMIAAFYKYLISKENK